MSFWAQYAGIFGGGSGGGGGGGSVTFHQETPAGLVNGSNVTYSLANVPTANANVLLFLDGVEQDQGVSGQYTVAGQTITMAVAPVAVPIPQTLWAFYS
jgi:hypothetical protein